MFEILNFESYIIVLLSAIYKKIIIAKLGANLACKCAVLVFRQFFLSPQFFLLILLHYYGNYDQFQYQWCAKMYF